MTTNPQLCVYHADTGRDLYGFVTHDNGGGNVDIVLMTDSTDWPAPPDVLSYTFSTRLYEGIDQGSSVGEWEPWNPNPVDISGLCDVPGAVTSAGLTLGASAVQLSTTRPALLAVRGTASQVSTLIAGQAYTVQLIVGPTNTPSAVVDDASGSFTQALGLTVTLTDLDAWKLVTIVPAGYYVKAAVLAGSTATVVLTASSMQLM